MKSITQTTLTLLLILHFSSLFGQTLNTSYLTTRYSLERMSTVGVGSNSILPGLPLSAPDLVGDPFLNEHYNTGKYLLYDNQVINDVPCKLDLLRTEFYFATKNGLRILDGNRVKSFTFQDSVTRKSSTYINGREFKGENGTAIVGFFEVIHDAPVALLKKTEAYVLKSNYNATLSVGNRDDRVKKKNTYHLLTNGVVTPLQTKSPTQVFGEKKAEIDQYIKTNQLKLKDEGHLKLIFEYYNQISGS